MSAQTHVSLPKAVVQWMLERTPVPILMWGMLLFLVAQKMGQWSVRQTTQWLWHDLIGMLVMASYFVLMRVLDEHKDFEADNELHPERPVQRGLISLNQLKAVGFICFLGQGAWSLYLDQGFGYVTLYWGLSMIWLALMTKEFFVESWLRPRVLIYGVSHMFIMCIIGLWLMQMGHPEQWIDPRDQMALMGLFFLSSFIPEITRKTWGPEEERDGIDSYSRFFGAKQSALVVILLLWCVFIIKAQYFTLYTAEPTSLYFWACAVLYLVASAIFALYIRKPSKTGRKMNEAAVCLSLLGSFTLLLVVLVQ